MSFFPELRKPRKLRHRLLDIALVERRHVEVPTHRPDQLILRCRRGMGRRWEDLFEFD